MEATQDVSLGMGTNYFGDTNYLTITTGSSSGHLSVGDLDIPDATALNCCFPNYYPTFLPQISYYPTYHYPNKQEQAFKIAAMLLEKKVIEEMVVSKFITLVNDIASVI